MKPTHLFLLLTVLIGFCLYVALPNSLTLPIPDKPLTIQKRPINFTVANRPINLTPDISLGLDLQGGSQLILQADMSQISSSSRADALTSAQEVIRRRIDAFGVAEPVIQTSVSEENEIYRIIVELPGVTDVEQAISLIGQTAQLEFREENPAFDWNEATMSGQAITLDDVYLATGLTGQDLKRAQVEFNPETGEPVVGLEFSEEGAKLFEQITERNIGRRVAVIIDGYPITEPVVNAVIPNGQAVISGGFDTKSAKNLSIQLNAGALPVPIEVVSQKNIGASLGQSSIESSLVAGLVGLASVMLFMTAYYGRLGIISNIALILYAIITVALYKLLGITLTLPGLAGFILSVGMAVDSNILIFERYKEEVRAAKSKSQAMEHAFGRAWDSIKDANVATLTICFILFNPLNRSFLNVSGPVRGFALTLALGIFISLFTGVLISRTLIRLFYQSTPTKS